MFYTNSVDNFLEFLLSKDRFLNLNYFKIFVYFRTRAIPKHALLSIWFALKFKDFIFFLNSIIWHNSMHPSANKRLHDKSRLVIELFFDKYPERISIWEYPMPIFWSVKILRLEESFLKNIFLIIVCCLGLFAHIKKR